MVYLVEHQTYNLTAWVKLPSKWLKFWANLPNLANLFSRNLGKTPLTPYRRKEGYQRKSMTERLLSKLTILRSYLADKLGVNSWLVFQNLLKNKHPVYL